MFRMECVFDDDYGFGIIKKSIDKYKAYDILGNTIFQPISSSDKVTLPSVQLAFQKDPKILYLPRAFGYEIWKQINPYAEELLQKSMKREAIESNIELRQVQEDIVTDTIKHLETHPAASIIAPTGIGKSFIIGELFSRLSVPRTCIVVPNITLFNQTKVFFNDFFPGLSVGCIQGQNKIKGDEKICIASLDTLKSRKDKIKQLYGSFDLIIFDESHKLGSILNNELLYRLPCRYLIGLSATKERADNGHFIIEKWFGKPIVEAQVNRMKMDCQVILCKFPFKTSFDPDRYSEYIDFLVGHKERNRAMLKYLRHLVVKKGRKNILILTERLKHLNIFADMIEADQNINLSVGRYDGTKTPTEREEALKADVICSTTSSFGTGVSIVRLDTLLFIAPRVSISQSIGRILRKVHDNGAIIVDFQDQLKKQAQKRLEIMKQELIFDGSETQYKDYDWVEDKNKWILRK